jgi:hypothetical protein
MKIIYELGVYLLEDYNTGYWLKGVYFFHSPLSDTREFYPW